MAKIIRTMANRIKELRTLQARMGITRGAPLARALGVSEATISRWFSHKPGQMRPVPGYILKFAALLAEQHEREQRESKEK